jgi:hypothetical protein
MDSLLVRDRGTDKGRTILSSSPLTLYMEQPSELLTLYDFETVALDRLRGE